MSAVLLILFGFLAAVSGLCLVKPEVVEGAMLGFFSSYSVCSRPHLGWTALVVIVVAVVHGVAGLDVWLLRMGRDWLWVVVLVVVFWFIYVYMA
ncbi:MAG: hypothetical protein JHC20_05325 [Pyrobaculum sp.]|nr:hypothetical protein [Pyrobaculum sp.]